VRKIAAQPSLSAQLREQIERQQTFQSAQDVLLVPSILDEGASAGRYFADMEAIAGFDAVTYLRSAPLSAIRALADRLAHYLADAASKPPITPSQSGNLRAGLSKKLNELEARLGSSDSSTALALEGLRAVVSCLPCTKSTTVCHGDLTLENLLIDRDARLWALDLTAPPFEHVWFDVAKLGQDLNGGWYLRSGPPIPASVRDCVLRQIDSVVDLPGTEVLAALEAISFARILPYASAHDRPFVLERVRALATKALN